MSTIKKASLDKLLRKPPSGGSKPAQQDIPSGQTESDKNDPLRPATGFDVGLRGGEKMSPKHIMLDASTLDDLEDLVYRLKKTVGRGGRRVTASSIMRAGFRAFKALPEAQQVRALEDEK